MKNIYDLIKEISCFDGNYHTNDVYFSINNMKVFAKNILNNIELCDLLITPFLINDEKFAIYELHYYEFELQLAAIDAPYYLNYPKENKLSKEITDNIKPKIYIPVGDNISFSDAVHTYICAMEKMKFQDEKVYLLSQGNDKLYFQFY